jgi:hypothetical protein
MPNPHAHPSCLSLMPVSHACLSCLSLRPVCHACLSCPSILQFGVRNEVDISTI